MIRLADPSFLLIAIIFLPLFLVRKTAFLGYSHLTLLEAEGGSRWGGHLPKLLLAITIAMLILTLARPQWRRVISHERFLARDIILVVDLSHSMENDVKGASRGMVGSRKIDMAKEAALGFIQKLNTDRIGLLVFGDKTFGSWPLTRDLDLISKKVSRLGAAFYGGTNLWQPFLKAMEHFRQMGQSSNRILVFLSDGEAMIPDKMEEKIITGMHEMGIRLYLLGINLREENSDLLAIAERTGGRFIDAGSAGALRVAFDEIDRLEPSMIEIEHQGKSKELYPIFVLVAISLLFILTVVRNTLFIELC